MKYRILGQTGIRVSQIALGTMTFGSDPDSQAGERVAAECLDMYAAAGGNLIDTANTYNRGVSERLLGKLLAGRRDRFIVGTKYTNQSDPTDPNSAGSSRKTLVLSLEASLRRLNTDYLDILWVHLRDELTPIDVIMRSLDDQIRAGKVLAIGASDWSSWEIARANTFAHHRGLTPFSAVQLRYNLLDRSAEPDLLPMTTELGITPLGWGPLADGRLTGKYLLNKEADGKSRLSNEGWFRFSREGGDDVVRRVAQIAEEQGASPAQVAISWILGQENGVVPIVAGRTPAQLRDNLGALQIHLTSTQRAALDRLSAPTLPFPHNVIREHSIALAAHGQQLPMIDDERARQVHKQTIYRDAPDGYRNLI